MFREIKSYRTGRIRFKIFCVILLVVASMAGASILSSNPDSPSPAPNPGEVAVVTPVEASEVATVTLKLPGYSLEVYDLTLVEEFPAAEVVQFQAPVNEEMLPLGVPIAECVSVTVFNDETRAWGPIPFTVDGESKTVTAFTDRAVRFGVVHFSQNRSDIKHRLPEFDGLGGALFSSDQTVTWTTGWEILNLHYGLPEASKTLLSGIPDRETVSRVELLLDNVDTALQSARQVKETLGLNFDDTQAETQAMQICFAEAAKLDAALLVLKQELNKQYTITVDLDYYDRVNDLGATTASLRNKQGEITQSMSFGSDGKAVFVLTLFEFLKTGGPTEVAVFVPAYPGYKEFKATLSYRLDSPQINLRAPYLTPSRKR